MILLLIDPHWCSIGRRGSQHRFICYVLWIIQCNKCELGFLLLNWFHTIELTSLFIWHSSTIYKTDVERRQTLGHSRSIIQTWSIMSPNNYLSFSKSCMLSVHEAITISYSYHLPCQGSRNCQKSDVSNHLFDMVRSPFQYCPSIKQIYHDYQNVIYQ